MRRGSSQTGSTCSARSVTSSPKPTTAYVYMCDLRTSRGGTTLPEGVDEVGVFKAPPTQMASEWSQTVLDYALRARRLGLR